MRNLVSLVALSGLALFLQGCTPKDYKKGDSEVYSNSKYLADFEHSMTLGKCKEYCDKWATTCPKVCKEDKACGLADDVDAKHYTREVSCTKKCIGFNMHKDDHCTLFADDVEL